jgi:Tfp pilus assembly PilM family ATPase
MSRNSSAIGLDIGRRSLKVVRLARGMTGPVVTMADTLMLPEGGAGVEQIVHGFLENHRLLQERCGVCVTGRSVMLHAFEVPYTNRRSKQQFAESETHRMHELAGDEILSAYSTSALDAGEDGVLVAMVQASAIQDALRIPDALGLNVVRVLPVPVALLYAQRPPRTGVDELLVFVDVGYSATHVAIGRSSGLLFTRRFEIGGLHFAKALETEMGMSYAQAEEEAVHHGLSATGSGGGVFRPEFRRVLVQATDRWVDELMATLTLGRERVKRGEEPFQTLLLSGGVAEMPGFRDYVAERTRLQVRHPAVLEGAMQEADAGRYAVACGAAMAALGNVGAGLNLLPPDRKQAAALRQQRPYWLWAGLALCLSLATLLSRYVLNYREETGRLDVASKRLESMHDMTTELRALQADNALLTESLRFARHCNQDGRIVKTVLASLGQAKHPGDWITLISDTRSYAESPSAGKTAREAPETFLDRIIVEGYTPRDDYSTVLSMIERLRKEPGFEKVDLLTDDRLVANADRRKAWADVGANLFTIEIQVREP